MKISAYLLALSSAFGILAQAQSVAPSLHPNAVAIGPGLGRWEGREPVGLTPPFPAYAAVSIGSSPVPTGGGPPSSSDPVVIERGPHYKVWERYVYESGPAGKERIGRSHRWVELATGLCFLDEQGQW